VTYFHSSKYITDLANGDICVAAVSPATCSRRQPRRRSQEGREHRLRDSQRRRQPLVRHAGDPKDAKNVKEAHAFINYLLKPEVIAQVSDYVGYANPNPGRT
jgi:putrescine transport system substrate-binding protein